MKLRIRNDELRLRLSQKEVDQFAKTGVLEDSVGFGPDAAQGLAFRIRRDEAVTTIAAELADNRIDILIPSARAVEWTTTKKVGIEAAQDIGHGHFLNIVVEKDFARLKPRTADDVLDKYPHPRAVE